MERAFVSVGSQYLSKTEHLHPDWALEREYPLTGAILAISHAWKPVSGAAHVIGAKGAPEAIVDLCHLGLEESARIFNNADRMANEGLRVLGVAKARSPSPALPGNQHDFDFSFVGLVGLEDPVRSEVPRAIRECREAGIRVVMMTGDHPSTARSIGRQRECLLQGSPRAKVQARRGAQIRRRGCGNDRRRGERRLYAIEGGMKVLR